MEQAQFQVQYSQPAQSVSVQKSISGKFAVLPSAFAVPTGGMLGAMLGYMIRLGLVEHLPQVDLIARFSFGQFVGCVFLGLITCLAMAKRVDSRKPISVEDFVGGLIVGCLAGLFSDEIISRLAQLVK